MLDSFLTAILVALLAAAVGYGVRYIPGVKDDNPVEEKCEDIIKKETGIDIDLTPRSPEKEKDEQ